MGQSASAEEAAPHAEASATEQLSARDWQTQVMVEYGRLCADEHREEPGRQEAEPGSGRRARLGVVGMAAASCALPAGFR